jgi:hypothetical protein
MYWEFESCFRWIRFPPGFLDRKKNFGFFVLIFLDFLVLLYRLFFFVIGCGCGDSISGRFNMSLLKERSTNGTRNTSIEFKSSVSELITWLDDFSLMSVLRAILKASVDMLMAVNRPNITEYDFIIFAGTTG